MIRDFNEKKPQIDASAYVDEAAVIIGDVSLAADVSVWPMSVLRGDVNSISIGKTTNIQDGAVLHVTHDGPYTPGGIPLIIGEGNTIGHKAMLHACTIEDYSLIGMNAIVLDGVVIESNVMVGAGSLVPPGKHLQAGYLYVGSPVKQVRRLTDKELEMLAYSADHYVRLKNRYKVDLGIY